MAENTRIKPKKEKTVITQIKEYKSSDGKGLETYYYPNNIMTDEMVNKTVIFMAMKGKSLGDAKLSELENFDEKWGNKYPKIAISWRDNWANLSTYFKYPQEVRTLIYTTNAIEGFNRQLRKVTKNKGVFPTDDSLIKMLYLAMMDITKKWTSHRHDWHMIRAQLDIYFEEELEGYNL